MTTAIETLDRLEQRQNQAAQLRVQLRASLAIQEFMPDAFAFGPCKVGATSPAYRPTPRNSSVRFTLGDGEVRDFPAHVVPEEIWPTTLLAAINRTRAEFPTPAEIGRRQLALRQKQMETFKRNLP